MELSGFDEEKFKQFLMEDLDGDMETALQLFKIYTKNTKEHIDLILKAVATGDRETVLRRAHSVKSSSGTLCLTDAQKQAADVEKSIRENIWNDTEFKLHSESLVKILQAAVNIVENKIKELS